MAQDLVQAPERRRHRLATELLRECYAMALHRAVGVIGADPDPQAVGERHEHRLDLARGLFAQHLDRVDRTR